MDTMALHTNTAKPISKLSLTSEVIRSPSQEEAVYFSACGGVWGSLLIIRADPIKLMW